MNDMSHIRWKAIEQYFHEVQVKLVIKCKTEKKNLRFFREEMGNISNQLSRVVSVARMHVLVIYIARIIIVCNLNYMSLYAVLFCLNKLGH